MRVLFQVISWVALVGTILPSVLFLADKIDLDQMKWIMAATMIVWFVVTPLWMGRDTQAPTETPAGNGGASQYPLSLLVFLALAISMASSLHAEDLRRPKKLIATGWDQPDSDRLAEIASTIDEQPFDGVVVQVLGRDDGDRPIRLNWAFLADPWKPAWFDGAIEKLKAAKFHRPMDNFVLLHANPGNVDWFDDAGWRQIVEHCRIAARVAKQSGFKGILFDPEPYAQPHAQFTYAAQADREKHSFSEYSEMARRRGREAMQAMAGEYPDITLFCFFLNSVNARATGQADPRRALQSSGYGLLPPFLDGWLDVAPPTVAMIDGCESAYHYNSRVDFLEAANLIRGACQELVSPENRAKYRAQVQVSFGIYLDAYVNPKDSPWYIDGQGGPRIERLRANVADALDAADEYVWLYGEKHRWWPTPNKAVRETTWPDALEGSDRVLRYVRDPVDYARKEIARLKAAGTLENLARNGDFQSESSTTLEGAAVKYRDGGPPAGWNAWQDEKSHGTFTWDRQAGRGGDGAARAAGVAGGCFLQSHAVEPGQRYAVAAMRRMQGRGEASIRVRWQTTEGRWTRESADRMIYADEAPPATQDGWSPMFGVVEVPEGVGRLVLLLGSDRQLSAEDIAWYDNVELYRLP